MKIKPEHYAHMLAAMCDAQAARPTETRDYYARMGFGKDTAKRHRWDLCYAAQLSSWICDNLYSYMDDTHIDTALRSIVKELEGRGL